jgi:hypothetical protein
MQHFQYRESKLKKGDLKFIIKYFIIELNSVKSNQQFSHYLTRVVDNTSTTLLRHFYNPDLTFGKNQWAKISNLATPIFATYDFSSSVFVDKWQLRIDRLNTNLMVCDFIVLLVWLSRYRVTVHFNRITRREYFNYN